SAAAATATAERTRHREKQKENWRRAAPAGRTAPCSASSPRGRCLARACESGEYGQPEANRNKLIASVALGQF
ncbi:MAG: hypothetical protein WAK67_04280, partial [Xanthobacteraceae bacterium]